MISLLPYKQRKKVHREYLLRLSTVALGMVTIVVVIGGVLLLPSLFATKTRGEVVEKQAELVGGVDVLEQQQETFALLLDAKKKIEILETEQVTVVDIIDDIIAITPSSTSLDSFSFENREEGIYVFKIGGTARTRDELVTFSEELESIPHTTDVALPVSNLAANRNINFSITMKIQIL